MEIFLIPISAVESKKGFKKLESNIVITIMRLTKAIITSKESQ